MMKTKIPTILLTLAFLAMLFPNAGAASGSVCNQFDFALGGNNKIMATKVCAPSDAAVGSEFYVNAYASITTGSLTISLDDAADWDFEGCSLVSSSDLDGTLTESTMALVSMDTATCSIHFYASEGLIVNAAVIPLVISVFDPNYDLPTAFTNTIDGQLDVDILSIPDLSVSVTDWPDLVADVSVTDWPTLFASVEITDWPLLAGALGVEITDWPTLISEVSGINVNATFLDAFQNATVQATEIEPEDFPSFKWFPLAFFMILMLWSLWNGYRLPALAAMLGVLMTYLEIGVAESGVIFFFVLAMWLTYYANHRKQKRSDEI